MIECPLMTRPRRAFLITAVTVFVLDSAALSTLGYFHFPQSWWIAVPIFAINLPAMPLAILYSAVLDETISKPMGIWLFATEVIISSLCWGYAAAKWVRRNSEPWPETQEIQGFPIITDEGKKK
jgi:hypothetical protein